MIEAGKKDSDRGLFIEHNQDLIFMYSKAKKTRLFEVFYIGTIYCVMKI
jgi:hypothetical protein